MSKNLNVAIIGCGFFGQQLAAAFHKANANLVGVTDINPELAEQIATQYNVSPYVNTEQLLQQAKPDLTLIATPNYAHYAPAIAALNSGSDLFIETPFALNSAHCKYIIELAQKQKCRIFVGHLLRLLPGIQRVKTILTQKTLGNVISVRATRQRWIDHSASKEWWKFDSNLTGGELLHQIHELDLLCWLIGDIRHIYAQSANQVHLDAPDSQDVIQLLFRFQNGVLGSLEMGTAYRQHDWGIVLHTENGTININFYTSSITINYSNGQSEHFHLYDEFEADLSLRESAKGIQQYNATNGLCPFWLKRAVEIEAQSIVDHFTKKQHSVLSETLSQAIYVAEAAKHSLITEQRVYLSM